MFFGKKSSAEFVQNNEDESSEDDASPGSEFEISENESDSSEGSVDEETNDVAGEHIDQNTENDVAHDCQWHEVNSKRVELHFKEKKHFI